MNNQDIQAVVRGNKFVIVVSLDATDANGNTIQLPLTEEVEVVTEVPQNPADDSDVDIDNENENENENDNETAEPLEVVTTETRLLWRVRLWNMIRAIELEPQAIDGQLVCEVAADTLSCGLYNIEAFSVDHRWAKRATLQVVEYTADANLQEGVEVEIREVRIDGLVSLGGGTSGGGGALVDGSVTTRKIADGAVTPMKLDRTYLTEVPTELTAAIDNAISIARGRATGYVFDTQEDMEVWLANDENKTKLNLGDNLYIRATNVPDYWWDGEQPQELETQKVNFRTVAMEVIYDDDTTETFNVMVQQ